MIQLGWRAPVGIEIRDLGFDGRKIEQRPFSAPGPAEVDIPFLRYGVAISIRPKSGAATYPILGGTFANLAMRDFIRAGVSARDIHDWEIVDNDIRRMGCHQVVDPCGTSLPAPNPWDLVGNVQPEDLAGLKLMGWGLHLWSNVRDTRIADNYIDQVMKVGIEIQGAACIDPLLVNVDSRDILIEDNVVEHAREGIGNNGACHLTYRNNTVRYSGVIGSEAADTGFGFFCRNGGGDSLWQGNLSEYNQRAGYRMACDEPFQTFIDNVSRGNCATAAAGAADTQFANESPERLLGGPTVTGHVIEDASLCHFGIWIWDRDGVVLTNSTIAGTADFTIWIRGSQNVSIENTTVTGLTNPTERGIGVYFDYENSAAPLENVYVKTSTPVTGYVKMFIFSSGHTPDDGDTVAACELETIPPPGCAP